MDAACRQRREFGIQVQSAKLRCVPPEATKSVGVVPLTYRKAMRASFNAALWPPQHNGLSFDNGDVLILRDGTKLASGHQHGAPAPWKIEYMAIRGFLKRIERAEQAPKAQGHLCPE